MKRQGLLTPEIRELLKERRIEEMKMALKDLHPVDVASILTNLEDREKVMVFRLLPQELALDTFNELDEEEQASLLSLLGKNYAATVLNEMAPDERADLFEELPEEIIERFLPLMSPPERADVEKLLKERQHSAGSIMTTEYASLKKDLTIGEALKNIRQMAPRKETIYYLYVVDNEEKLVGVVSLKDLVLGEPSQKIAEIMHPEVISVKKNQDQEEVARLIAKYNFLAVPVVDKKDKLSGIVTVDDTIDIIKEENTEDIHKMAAMEAPEEEYFKSNFFTLARKRILWLIALLIAQTFTGNILKGYSHCLEAIVALAFFIPMLIDTAGNAGTQSASIVIRGLATGEFSLRQTFRILKREILIGLTLGLILGTFGLLRAFWMQKDPLLSIAVGAALVVTVTLATISGAFFPLLLRKVKLDPAVAAGPFITTVIDIAGLIIYFQIARFLLHI